MIYYLDSSAVVKIYIEEAGSDWMRNLRRRAQRGEILLCEVSGAEVFAAFYRRSRGGNISAEDLQTACQIFRTDFDQFFALLPITKTIVHMGMHLISKYPLRGYDSIQLTTAVHFLNELRQLNGQDMQFIGADKVLNEAARNEGLTVINPAEQE